MQMLDVLTVMPPLTDEVVINNPLKRINRLLSCDKWGTKTPDSDQLEIA